MDTHVLLLVLLAALLHAGWNALVKVGSDGLIRLALINLTGGAAAVAMLPFFAVPAPAAWPFLLGSVLVHQCYYAFLVQGYRYGDLSVVYPVARGVAPLLVAVGAAAFAGEYLSWQGVAAVVLVCAAIASLAFPLGPHLDRRTLMLALGAGASIASYSVLDGLGGRSAGDVFGYIAWLFALDSLPIVLYAAYRRRAAMRRALAGHWRAGIGGGCLALGAYGTVIWAMTQAPLTFVSALRETSVIMAAVIGAWIFREGSVRRRLGAAVTVTCGVAVLHLVGRP